MSGEAGDGVSGRVRSVRALIVYRHAFLRDLTAKVLSGGGVEVVAAVKPEDLDEALLELLTPDVLVMDQAALEGEGVLPGIALLGRRAEVMSRVVVVDLSNPNMLVWQRHLVTNADVSKLVEAVESGLVA